MSFCSSFSRILRSQNLRNPSSNPIAQNAYTSDVVELAFQTGYIARISRAFSVGGQDALRIDRQSPIYSSYGNRAATKNGSQSLGQQTHMSEYRPSYASGLRAIHWITFSDYQQSGYYRDSMKKIKGLDSKAVFQFRRVRSRFYSGGPDVIWTLIGVNVGVFTMWRKVNDRFMDKHFTASIDSVLSGRLYTILTSAFSQKDMGHLLTNLIGLYFFGSSIGRNFGGTYLLGLYLAGAIGGSFGHLFYYAYVYPWLKDIPRHKYNIRNTPGVLGASGAVTTLLLLHIFLFPNHIIYIYMLIPMPAALVGAIIIGRDLWLAKHGDSDVSVGGHLGGAVVALLAFLAQKL